MKKTAAENRIPRLRDVRGISRAVVIMIVLVAVMLVAVSIPTYIHYRDKWREIKCMTSLDSAKRQMVDQFLLEFGDLSKEEAKEHVGYVMNGWDDLCPGGGIVYIVEDKSENAEMPYKLVCGIHGEDKKELTRLNANYVFEHVCERVKLERAKDAPIPEIITLTLNSEQLTVYLVTENQNLKRGTKYTDEKNKIVAYFGVEGNGDFGDSENASEGDVCYFAYADENYCANWTADNWWSGDSWITVEHSGEVLPG